MSLVVWDFDHTLINENSDTWFVERLAPELVAEWAGLRKDGVGWTACVDRQLAAVHGKGVSKEELSESLRAIPIQEGMLGAVSLAQAAGARQAIVSDANIVFIETILQHHAVTEPFAVGGIFSNGATWSAEGRLSVAPYHPADAPPHGCEICKHAPNMCKGLILDTVLQRARNERVVYIGDGKGDFCPLTRLLPGDVALVRHGGAKTYGLYTAIQQAEKAAAAAAAALSAEAAAAAAEPESAKSTTTASEEAATSAPAVAATMREEGPTAKGAEPATVSAETAAAAALAAADSLDVLASSVNSHIGSGVAVEGSGVGSRGLRCDVRYWDTGNDVLAIFRELFAPPTAK